MERLDKQSIKIAVLYLFWICTLSFISCSEDEVVNQTSNTSSENISFGIKKETESRSLESYPSQYFVLHNEDGTDSLYLKASVTEGIDLDTEDLISRGALVTAGSNINQFGVMAYKENTTTPWFNETATQTTSDGQTIWATTTTHYWPNEGKTLDFYSYYPSASTTINVGSDKTLTASYTIPSTATSQMDAMIAINEGVTDNYRQPVNLSFHHLCTAVKFKFADDIEAIGTIQKIEIRGVKGGIVSYVYSNGKWSVTNTTEASASYSLENLNKSTTNSDKNITDDNSTVFLLAPQELPDGAKIFVTFQEEGYEPKVIASDINGTWPIGNTVTYILSINPFTYDLTISMSDPGEQDAHYVICPITINFSDAQAGNKTLSGSWELSASASDGSTVTLRRDLTTLQKQGYWTENERGTTVIEGTENSGKITVYAFLEENPAVPTTDNTGNRTITLTLQPTADKYQNTQVTHTITQLCPHWNGNTGGERIEENKTYPYGFNGNRKVTYTNSTAIVRLIYSDAIESLLGVTVNDNTKTGEYSIANGLIKYTVASGFWGIGDNYISKIVINYGVINNLSGHADNLTNGLNNTIGLFEYTAGINVLDLEGTLDSYTGSKTFWFITYTVLTRKIEETQATSTDEYAAYAAIKKNKFTAIEEIHEGEDASGNTITVVTQVAKINANDIKWYLPALDQATNDSDYPLEGDYWTSTSYEDNTNTKAYYYHVENGILTTGTEERGKTLKIRAVRDKDNN